MIFISHVFEPLNSHSHSLPTASYLSHLTAPILFDPVLMFFTNAIFKVNK